MAVFVIGSRSRVHGLQARRKAAWMGPPPLGAMGQTNSSGSLGGVVDGPGGIVSTMIGGRGTEFQGVCGGGSATDKAELSAVSARSGKPESPIQAEL